MQNTPRRTTSKGRRRGCGRQHVFYKTLSNSPSIYHICFRLFIGRVLRFMPETYKRMGNMCTKKVYKWVAVIVHVVLYSLKRFEPFQAFVLTDTKRSIFKKIRSVYSPTTNANNKRKNGDGCRHFSWQQIRDCDDNYVTMEHNKNLKVKLLRCFCMQAGKLDFDNTRNVNVRIFEHECLIFVWYGNRVSRCLSKFIRTVNGGKGCWKKLLEHSEEYEQLV